MSDINEIHDQFMDALNAQDARAANQLFHTWAKAYAHVQASIQRLDEKIEKAKANGQYSPSWAYQRGHLDHVTRTITNQMQRLTDEAQGLIVDNQQHAITQGQAFAAQSTVAQLGGPSTMAHVGVQWAKLDPKAVEHMVGYLADGSPLRSLLDQIPQRTATAIKDALIDGIVHGRNPRVTASIIKREAAVPLVRATRIARTETMRAYRAASLDSMKANDKLVDGWIWLASLSKRTCPVCLAMHGTWHPLEEGFASHISCRCCPVPSTRPWFEILGPSGDDLPDTSVNVSENAGWDYYQRQSVAVQNQMVGPGKRRLLAELHDEHRLANPLRTLVGYRVDDDWGPERFEKPLRELLPQVHAGNIPHVDGIHPNGISIPGLPDKQFIQTYESSTGALVHEEQGYNESPEGKEVTVARYLADAGRNVWLQNPSNTKGIVTSDGFMQDSNRALLIEIKRVATTGNIAERVHSSVREGSRQAENVVLYIDRAGADFTVLEARVHHTLFRYPRVRRVILMRQDGTIEAEIFNDAGSDQEGTE